MKAGKSKSGNSHFSPKASDAKNASEGGNGASRGGTQRTFPASTNGNNFARPAAQNNASEGQTDGHNMGRPAQTRAYGGGATGGGNQYCPKAGDAKSASDGEGPNSTGGTTRSYPK